MHIHTYTLSLLHPHLFLRQETMYQTVGVTSALRRPPLCGADSTSDNWSVIVQEEGLRERLAEGLGRATFTMRPKD